MGSTLPEYPYVCLEFSCSQFSVAQLGSSEYPSHFLRPTTKYGTIIISTGQLIREGTKHYTNHALS